MHYVAGMFSSGQYGFSEDDGQEWISFSVNCNFIQLIGDNVNVKNCVIPICYFNLVISI